MEPRVTGLCEGKKPLEQVLRIESSQGEMEMAMNRINDCK